METKVEKFKRLLRNLESQQDRVAREGYGRNARGTTDAMAFKVNELHRMVMRDDDVVDALDTDDKLAARYRRAERRFAGLPV